MSELEASYLVNAVSAYATILSGLLTLTLSFLMTRQPLRWLFVYLCIFVTGVATVWYHGFGEQFPAQVADIGTNLLLAWAIQVAIVGDYYPGRIGRFFNLVVALVNLEYILTFATSGNRGSTPLVLAFGQVGGFTLGELLLIVNCAVAVALFYFRRREIVPEARSLLNLVTIIFFVGMLFATTSNTWIDFRILAYHATWHIVGAFGFIAIWAFNELRFRLADEAYEEEYAAEYDEDPEVLAAPPPVPSGDASGRARAYGG